MNSALYVYLSLMIGTLLFGITAPSWIWWMKYLKEIDNRWQKIDGEVVELNNPTTISQLRKNSDYGLKIVVVHYFRNAVIDATDKLRLLSCVCAFIPLGLFFFNLTQKIEPIRKMTDTQAYAELANIGISSAKSGFSILSIALTLGVVYFLRQEAAKFKSVL